MNEAEAIEQLGAWKRAAKESASEAERARFQRDELAEALRDAIQAIEHGGETVILVERLRAVLRKATDQ